jgi:hypothetical protein
VVGEVLFDQCSNGTFASAVAFGDRIPRLVFFHINGRIFTKMRQYCLSGRFSEGQSEAGQVLPIMILGHGMALTTFESSAKGTILVCLLRCNINNTPCEICMTRQFMA